MYLFDLFVFMQADSNDFKFYGRYQNYMQFIKTQFHRQLATKQLFFNDFLI